MISFSVLSTSSRVKTSPVAAYPEDGTYTSGFHRGSTELFPAFGIPGKQVIVSLELVWFGRRCGVNSRVGFLFRSDKTEQSIPLPRRQQGDERQEVVRIQQLRHAN